ncbi:MAG: hypothetical protein OXG64_08575 [Chloroflexi bacterium]|nr:hypothetical protein [Chloroflexota bacterium]MCY3959589.1 hypothetical protein [Chloroflexota bacterium]
MRKTTQFVGAVLLGYTVVYVAQFVGSALYEGSGQVWAVLNVLSALAIAVALGFNLRRLVSLSPQHPPDARLSAQALVLANAALAIWFAHNWLRLLILPAGESVPVPHDVVWQAIGVLIPLVLVSTGWRLWRAR